MLVGWRQQQPGRGGDGGGSSSRQQGQGAKVLLLMVVALPSCYATPQVDGFAASIFYLAENVE